MVKNVHIRGAFVLGVVSVFAQTVFLRELFAVFGFSELFVAVLLFFWLFWGALGSLFYRRGEPGTQLAAFALCGVAAPTAVRAAAAILRPELGLVAPLWNVCAAGAACSAFTALGGRAFAALAQREKPSTLYAAEGVGAFVGGALSAISLRLLSPLASLVVVALAPLAVMEKRGARLFVLALVAVAVASAQVSALLAKRLWRGFDVTELESPYGRIVVLQRGGESYIYQSGHLLGSSCDTLSAEQAVHPVLWAHPNPRRVLLIGGVMQGAIRDVLKHRPEKVVVPFPDEKLLYVAAANIAAVRHSLAKPQVEVLREEASTVLKEHSNEFDVILLMPGLPASGADNRFWTREFFSQAKSALSEGGIAAAVLPVGANALSAYQRELCASVLKTFRSVFPDAEVYFLDAAVLFVGGRAGAVHLRERLLGGAPLREVSAATMPPQYLPILLQRQRSETLSRQLGSARFGTINRNWRPMAYLWGVLEQAYLGDVRIPLKVFGPAAKRVGIMLLVFAAALCGAAFAQKGIAPVAWAAAGGFWGMTSQSTLLLLLQANYGNLYWLVGAGVGTFLLGSAAGSVCAERIGAGRSSVMCCAAVGALVGIAAAGAAGAKITLPAFFAAFALAGATSGLTFGGVAALGVPGGKVYGADLAGAAVGAAAATYMIPNFAPWQIMLAAGALVVVLGAAATVRRQ